MSDETLHDTDFIYRGTLATRMACHMGDAKASVLCNILGDQPLFYIDYVDAEETDFADPLDLLAGEMGAEFYPENLELLRERMARLESASHHIDGYARENVDAAFDAAASFAKNEHTVEQVLALLTQSRVALAMYTDAKARNLQFIMDAQVDTAAYDRDQITIRVNPRLPLPLAALMTTRALRQAWLHLNGAAINPLHFAPEEAVLLNRIQHADLVTTMIRAAWELNLAGEKDVWARILTGSAYDLAAGFAREAIADFRSLNNGQAAHATFERWFFSGRCKDVDRKLIQSMLADHHGLVFDNPAVSKMVTGDIIARTGDQPTGKNYLTGLVDMILSDPLFTEVRDRSNANFLWFIKFERSFRASEDNLDQNLHGIPAIPAGAITGASSKKQGEANAQAAEIIAFKTNAAPAQGVVAKKNGTNDMATVYYLDHFLTLSNR